MRVVEVSYSELVSFSDFSNRRVGFSAKLDPGEDPISAVVKLYKMARRVHEALGEYHKLVSERAKLEEWVKEVKEDLKRTSERIRLLEMEAEKARREGRMREYHSHMADLELKREEHQGLERKLISLSQRLAEVKEKIRTLEDELKLTGE